MSESKAANKVLDVFNALLNTGFHGETIDQISQKTGLTYPTVRRALQLLEKYDFAFEYTKPGSKTLYWRFGEGVIRIANSYRMQALEAVHNVEKQYFETTGERLKHD